MDYGPNLSGPPVGEVGEIRYRPPGWKYTLVMRGTIEAMTPEALATLEKPGVFSIPWSVAPATGRTGEGLEAD